MKTVKHVVRQIFSQEIVETVPLSGGCLGSVARLRLMDGKEIIAKSGDNLACEVWMINFLNERKLLPMPEIYYGDENIILMSLLPGKPESLNRNAQYHLAESVAALHGNRADQFGLSRDTVIGPLRQPNRQAGNWGAFFRDHRLLFMADQAYLAGRLPEDLHQDIRLFSQRLDIFLDHEPVPSLIHGDLWGGNILSRQGRITGFVDPALYYADPEIELAFMTLFNTVGHDFFDAYGSLRPFDEGGFQRRRNVYLLYPLLVHVALFGGSYVEQLKRTLKTLQQ